VLALTVSGVGAVDDHVGILRGGVTSIEDFENELRE
jgi:hypothetical protein